MRRYRWLGVALLITTAACGGGDSDSAVPAPAPAPPVVSAVVERPTFAQGSTMARIQGEGKISVGVKFDQPGLGLRNPETGQLEGFDVEIARLVALGIFGGSSADIDSHIEWVEATTPNREALLEAGTVDLVVASYTINDARRARVDFAGPYYVASQDVMVKLADTTINGVADLSGKRTCSARGSTPAANIAKLAPTTEVVLFDGYAECVQALRDGQVQAVTTDNSILLGFIANSPIDFKLLGLNLADEPYGIAVQKGDAALRSFVNDRIDALYAGGEWEAAFTATLGKLGIALTTPPAVQR